MLKITIEVPEEWDPVTSTFYYPKPVVLTLEHSLLSVSKWEMKHKKPFINQSRTAEELDDYIRCMTLTQNVPAEVYRRITPKNREEVQRYIDDTMTAAVIHDDGRSRRSNEFVTSDLIYYWMVESNIPFDPCQKWHLNRLLTLIRIVGIKRRTDNKMSKADSIRHHAATNASRRAKLAKNKRR